MKVKIFWNPDFVKLENDMNNFLAELDRNGITTVNIHTIPVFKGGDIYFFFSQIIYKA